MHIGCHPTFSTTVSQILLKEFRHEMIFVCPVVQWEDAPRISLSEFQSAQPLSVIYSKGANIGFVNSIFRAELRPITAGEANGTAKYNILYVVNCRARVSTVVAEPSIN